MNKIDETKMGFIILPVLLVITVLFISAGVVKAYKTNHIILPDSLKKASNLNPKKTTHLALPEETSPSTIPPTSPTHTPTFSPTLSPSPRPTSTIKIPSVKPNISGYAVTAHGKDKVLISQILGGRLSSGGVSSVTSVDFISGSSGNITWSTSPYVNPNGGMGVNFYLNVGNTPVGYYTWTQRVVIHYDNGNNRDFAFTIDLTIVPN